MLLSKLVNRKNKGFTLVELMVVVVIIGVLVAIAIPIYAGVQETARERACDANVRTLQGAVAQFEAETGAAPTAIADLWTDTDGLQLIQEEPFCPDSTGGNTTNYALTNGTITRGIGGCGH